MKADLHIHTVLSPCGDLDMSPVNIVLEAKQKGLDIIGITDHNTTRQAQIIHNYAKDYGITVLMGVEINTQEEVHCLAFFPTSEYLNQFQNYLDQHLPNIPNNPDNFGYQVVADIDDTIIYEEKRLLISALDQNIESVEKMVHHYKGIFIPAHINKTYASILSQLGFIPPSLNCDALEISSHITCERFIIENNFLQKYPVVQFSDAHYLQDIGEAYTNFELNDNSFESIQKAIMNRFVSIK